MKTSAPLSEPKGRAKQQNNLSASLPWNGRWGFFLCLTLKKNQTTMKREKYESQLQLLKVMWEKT